jgi:hypothetical protein
MEEGILLATRGNPYAIVRLEPEIMQMLQDRARPRRRGRGGGVSQFLRELVYDHLGLGVAPCFGEAGDVVDVVAPVRIRRDPPAAPELL